jgi:hypothetical protein
MKLIDSMVYEYFGLTTAMGCRKLNERELDRMREIEDAVRVHFEAQGISLEESLRDPNEARG